MNIDLSKTPLGTKKQMAYDLQMRIIELNQQMRAEVDNANQQLQMIQQSIRDDQMMERGRAQATQPPAPPIPTPEDEPSPAGQPDAPEEKDGE